MQPSDEMDENITHWEWPVAESSQQHAERVALLQPILYDALYGIDTSHEQKSPDLRMAHKGKALSVNVSSGGMLLMMDHQPQVNQALTISVPMSDGRIAVPGIQIHEVRIAASSTSGTTRVTQVSW